MSMGKCLIYALTCNENLSFLKGIKPNVRYLSVNNRSFFDTKILSEFNLYLRRVRRTFTSIDTPRTYARNKHVFYDPGNVLPTESGDFKL